MRQLFQTCLILLLTAPSLGLAQDFYSGLQAAQSGDYETALENWIPLAEEGDALAQYNLGIIYSNGHGVPQDDAEAVRWYRLAAEQGVASAQFTLGVMYDKGSGVPQDYVEAVRWYRLAAEQGFALAQFNLGVMYDKGSGVPQDYVEAVRWYRFAAKQGYAASQNNLAIMYEYGSGVLQDNQTAHMWYNIASANGSEKSGKWRDRLAAKMSPSDVGEAQKRARVCMDSAYADCD